MYFIKFAFAFFCRPIIPILFLPGEERYMAKAQGLVGFEIFEGDKISIINIEGKQECEIVSFFTG
jgi:uncharacterized protein YcgI (DUF1989 family)